MKKQLLISYEEIISPENLFAAWQEFLSGKRKKKDVQEFGMRLADNILQLSKELANFSYRHGEYTAFNISDPKPRDIHKASVRDRVLHHAIYRKLYPFFDKTFIADSYSCRVGKGVHKALNKFRSAAFKASKNHTKTVWVLKCDIRKFFASIGHGALTEILKSYIPDKNIMWLLERVIGSFKAGEFGVIARRPSASEADEAILNKEEIPRSARDHARQEEKIASPFRQSPEWLAMTQKGLPLGNLTSQLFCNVYMNEFDQLVKHKLKARYYIRYADDFVFLSHSREELLSLIPKISLFLERDLKLSLHPDKVFIKTLASGVDFLGWTHFPHRRILRTTTGRRMLKRMYNHPTNETLQSYLGLIKHGNAYGLKQKLLDWHGLLKTKSE